MKKGEWYRYLFERVTHSINEKFFFEAAFICYGIIDDRLNSILREMSLSPRNKMVKKKIIELSGVNDKRLEKAFGFKNWEAPQRRYTDIGLLADVIAWCELYRNPMQHVLGDPRDYKAQVGNFHTELTYHMAKEGEEISRKLSAAVMRIKKL